MGGKIIARCLKWFLLNLSLSSSSFFSCSDLCIVLVFIEIGQEKIKIYRSKLKSILENCNVMGIFKTQEEIKFLDWGYNLSIISM